VIRAKLFVLASTLTALFGCAFDAKAVEPQVQLGDGTRSAFVRTPTGHYPYAVATGECLGIMPVVAIYFLEARSSQLPPRKGDYIKVTLAWHDADPDHRPEIKRFTDFRHSIAWFWIGGGVAAPPAPTAGRSTMETLLSS
jgi:hypothetical protein